MRFEKPRTATLFVLTAAAIALAVPLPTDGAIGPGGGCNHNAGPNERGDVSGTSHGAVGGGGTEGTTGLSSDDGCPSSLSSVSGARGPAGPTIDSSTTGPDSRPPSGIG
ncbi:hypothetical protein [Mycobacterium sp. 3519A]|uniref:hypothetical protein n=1 Tax=Mycobacterium sp. 3519A TaxID=2057184 RepID=UPI001158F208|nr:hypothetical protein [Mycobacterium sp. 3519A]